MLILTRKIGEQIMIGYDVVVTVVDIRGESAQIGINAPRQVAVHRGEVHAAIQHQRSRKIEDFDPGEDA